MKTILTAAALALLFHGTAWAVDATALYDKKCKVCHSIGGVGGPMAKVGGALDNVGNERDEAWLRAYFADPKSKIDNAKMPKINLSAEEWDALVAYMLTLKTPGAN